MEELQYSLQQAMADAAGLRETSQKQARQLAQQVSLPSPPLPALPCPALPSPILPYPTLPYLRW